MNSDKLFQAIGLLNDDIVKEAREDTGKTFADSNVIVIPATITESSKRTKLSWQFAPLIAAMLVLAIGTGLMFHFLAHDEVDPIPSACVPPPEGSYQELTYEQALADERFGVFVPTQLPTDFELNHATRYIKINDETNDALGLTWYGEMNEWSRSGGMHWNISEISECCCYETGHILSVHLNDINPDGTGAEVFGFASWDAIAIPDDDGNLPPIADYTGVYSMPQRPFRVLFEESNIEIYIHIVGRTMCINEMAEIIMSIGAVNGGAAEPTIVPPKPRDCAICDNASSSFICNNHISDVEIGNTPGNYAQ
jgi:hypothetical protein